MATACTWRHYSTVVVADGVSNRRGWLAGVVAGSYEPWRKLAAISVDAAVLLMEPASVSAVLALMLADVDRESDNDAEHGNKQRGENDND